MDQKAFKPSIFGTSTEKARATFDEWYRKRKDSLLVHDDFITQLKDLIKTRNPSRSLSESDYVEEINSYRVGRDLQNCGCWVYYPWSSRLVHLLGKSEFTELRTNRNRYKIMPDEQQVLEKKRVGVVGLSVGQSVAIAMTLERSYGLIRLADFDTLDLSNMNRIRTGVHNLGLPKALLTAREIAEIDPYVEVECFLDGLTEANIEHFLKGNDTRTPLDVLVDECDDLAMKVLMRQRARQLRIPVVMDTSDRGMLDVERFDLEPSRPIFHGIIDDLEYRKLKGLTTEQKIPYVMKFIGGIENTPRMAASLMEIGQTISTWPQLASDVLLGGAIAAETIRRIHLRQFQGSGRYFVCPQEIISDPLSTSTNEGTSETLHSEALDPPTLNFETKFPEPRASGTLDLAFIRDAVRMGALAPTGGNTQPWKWSWNKGVLHLYLDPLRAPMEAMADFRRLGAYLGLGAAAENVILFAQRQGFQVGTRFFAAGIPSDPSANVEVVRFVFSQPSASVQDEFEPENDVFSSLADFIEQRHTSRKLGKPDPLSKEFLHELKSAAESPEGTRLRLFSGREQLTELGKILGAGDRIRFLSKKFHAELMSELRFTHEETVRTCNGIDIDTLDMSATDRIGLQLCRSWAAMQLVGRAGGGSTLEKLAQKVLAHSSAAALLTVNGHSPQDYFRAGRGMQRAWLTATQREVTLQPMCITLYFFIRLIHGRGEGFEDSQVQELTHLRKRYLRLFDVLDSEGEAFLFCLTYAPPASVRALRRPIDAILVV